MPGKTISWLEGSGPLVAVSYSGDQRGKSLVSFSYKGNSPIREGSSLMT